MSLAITDGSNPRLKNSYPIHIWYYKSITADMKGAHLEEINY